MSGFKRTDRIAEMIQRKLAQIILKDGAHHNLPKFVTISAVTVSADLSHAKIYFTVFDVTKEQAVLSLNGAAPYLRSILAKTSTLRTVPQLHFIYDESIDYGNKLSQLIDEVNKSTNQDNEDDKD